MGSHDQSLVLAAVCDHARFWWADDGADYWIMQDAFRSRTVPADLIGSIARRYHVGRALLTGKQNAYGVLLFSTAEDVDDSMSLTEKAQRVFSLASKAEGAATKGVAISAATKLFWFVKPKNWTLYDSYALNALGLRSSSRLKNFEIYYQTLEDLDITSLWAEMREVIAQSQLDFLWPERITDKALWLLGGNTRLPLEQRLDRKYVLRAFGEEHGALLQDLAGKLLPIVAASQFGKLLPP